MSKIPNGDEILAMAESIEEKGMNFYNRMADKFYDQAEIANIFKKLADDESEHKALFHSFRQDKSFEMKINAHAVSYIKSLLEPLFSNEEESNQNPATPKLALAVGIEAEKTSILFYHELYEAVENEQDRKTISKLLKEEKLHLVELRDFWDEL